MRRACDVFVSIHLSPLRAKFLCQELADIHVVGKDDVVRT